MFKSEFLKNLFSQRAQGGQSAESNDRLDQAAHATDLSGNPHWPTSLRSARFPHSHQEPWTQVGERAF